MRIARLATLAVLLVLPTSGALQAQPAGLRTFTLDDHARVASVPRWSPDGEWSAYTVRTPDVEEDERNTDVWMVSADGGQHVQLTSSPENKTHPCWSPDGRYLAFLASRGDEDEKEEGGPGLAVEPRGW